MTVTEVTMDEWIVVYFEFMFQLNKETEMTKEQVRAYMAARQLAKTPPPSRDDIRRQLGWPLAQPQGTR